MKVVIGVGNEFRRDDAIGIKIVERLKEEVKEKNIEFFLGFETPENLIEKVKELNPDKLFIIDAIDFSGEIGEVKRLRIKKDSFFTHKPTYEIFHRILGCETEIIGIQPKDLSYGEGLSNELSSKLKEIKERVKIIILS